MTKQRRQAVERVMGAASQYATLAIVMVSHIDDKRAEFTKAAAECQRARKRLRRYVLESSR